MTLAGWLEIIIILALVLAAAIPLSSYIARVLAGERTFLSPVLVPVERGFYKLAGVDPAREQGWITYTMAMLAFSVVGFITPLSHPALPEFSAVEPARLRSGRPRSRLQYVGELHHQHQLAELRRRDDDEPSHADAGAHGPQLPVRRDRPRHGLGAGARLLAFGGEDHRQFLGRSHARGPLYPSADLHRRRHRPHPLRRAADAARLRRCDDARRCQADDLARPGGEPGDHQGARHQRRRLLQRQFRPSVRESQRLVGYHRELGASGHPGRQRSRLRPCGR